MADVAFSDLAELTTLADDDLFCVTDDSESSAEQTKYIKASTLRDYLVPPGAVMAWTTNTAPTGWLECDGSAVSRTTYADLYSAVGDVYGNGDGSTTFNLPDYRGYFLRGYDNSAGNDPDSGSRSDRGDATTGDNVGTSQSDAYDEHYHFVSNSKAQSDPDSLASDNSVIKQYNSNDNREYILRGHSQTPDRGRTSSSGGNETRPKNIYVMWIIKY